MCGPDLGVYTLVGLLVPTLSGLRHAATAASVSALVWALLASQSLHPSALARALVGLATPRARQAQRRVRRIVGRLGHASQRLTPALIRVALRLSDAAPAWLVLDSTRCQRRWELFTLGVRLNGGAVLLVGWQVLPYPWPARRFTPTVVALLDQVLAAWPADVPVHLVADRGFPSLEFFAALARWRRVRRLEATIRLRAGDYVWTSPQTVRCVGDYLRPVGVGEGTLVPAAYRRQEARGPAGYLVVARGQPLIASQQSGPADTARRARRAQAREAHLRRKRQPGALATDHVWGLWTTVPHYEAALVAYSQRFSVEPTYRALNTWDLETVVTHEASAAHVAGYVALSALALVVQVAVGVAAGRTPDPEARARQDQWSTADRLSAFWRGRQVFHDHAHDWRAWLQVTLADLHLTLDDRATIPAWLGGDAPAAPPPRAEAA
jgi:hypothetical protein